MVIVARDAVVVHQIMQQIPFPIQIARPQCRVEGGAINRIHARS